MTNCTCNHSRRAHGNGRGRCRVRGCGCLFPPAPVHTDERTPSHERRVTVDADGLVLSVQRTDSPSKRGQRERLERQLWRLIEEAGLPLPDELEFAWARAEGRRYRSDAFYRLPVPTLIEVDGGTWLPTQGRHNHPIGFEADCDRANLANLMGYRLLKFTGAMIRSGRAVQTIRRALQPTEVML